MRITEVITEARQGSLREIIRSELVGWPDYVIKDWISTRIKDEQDLKDLVGWIRELAKQVQPNSWKLHQGMQLTFDMLDAKTRYFMKTKRSFGAKNPFLIPRDEERSANAEALIKSKGMENLPPVIMLRHANGLELAEGWHRTMAAFRLQPQGFKVNAWIADATDIKESLDEESQEIPQEIYNLLDELTADDTGSEDFGNYVLRFEGFTDWCQQDAAERCDLPDNDPRKLKAYDDVYTEVLSGWIKEQGSLPVDRGFSGSEDYPIQWAIFRK